MLASRGSCVDRGALHAGSKPSAFLEQSMRSKDMKTVLFAAAAAILFAPAAHAQAGPADSPAGPETPSDSRIEPYVGVIGGIHNFDSEPNHAGVPAPFHGRLVQGVAGVNLNIGPAFIGAEGNASKGVSGAIDWEYGAAGRFGIRAGKDSMIFGKVGYQWVNFDALGENSRDYHDWTYGAGVELSLADMGMRAERSNLRLRIQADTFGDFHSIRPMAGVVLKY
jgi:outer membrane immunogenic protein